MRAAIVWLEAIYGSFEEGSRVPRHAIEAAEARNAVVFPAALSLYYRVTGASKALHTMHNCIVPVDRVAFAGEYLVFYEENQGVCVWGVHQARLAEEDPPVDQGHFNEGSWTFYPDLPSISDFARAEGAWQAVQGALPWVGVLDEQEERRSRGSSRLEARLGPPSLHTPGLDAWLVEGGVALDAEGYLGLATWDAAKFIAATELIGVAVEDWDYATVTDEGIDGA